MDNTQNVGAWPVISEWSLVSKDREEDGTYTHLRVVKNADGSGNVYLQLPSGGEAQWFRDGCDFDAEPAGYLEGPEYIVTRVF